MSKRGFKYIYGPVSSWRLGRSLGIDLLSGQEKYCSFDCLYCQLGKVQRQQLRRRLFVPTEELIAEIRRLPPIHIDYITFSGRGEPTLALNLGQAIRAVKELRQEPVAVLTNASLLGRRDVRQELCLADLVAVKLDADSEQLFRKINRPAKRIKFSDILKGIKQLRREYRGRLALQIMMIRENQTRAENIARLAKDLEPDEVQICTPVRPAAVKALSRQFILSAKKYFPGLRVTSVYDLKPRRISPISKKSTLFRRSRT